MTKAAATSKSLDATATLALDETKAASHYSTASMGKISRALAAQAADSPGGVAGQSLETYPNHFTMLTVRTKSGGAEIHEHNADVFIVIGGTATLVTGGTLKNSRMAGEGETRGTAIAGGHKQDLRKGDIVHIPPGIPHQLQIPSGKPFTYFVVKVHE